MSGRRIGQGSVMGRVRQGAAGIARVLILAFALQLLAPLLDLGSVAATIGEAGLQADLQSSLCHDAGAEQPQPPPSSAHHPAKHCVFCLPMAGDHATTSAAPFLLLPGRAATIAIRMAPDQVSDLSRPAFARSRAPPSALLTV